MTLWLSIKQRSCLLLSLPNGCRSLPVDLLPLLERFETIYLWMDDDLPGQEGCEKFVKKLGAKRCLIVKPDEEDLKFIVGEGEEGEEGVEGETEEQKNSLPKDANEALLRGFDLQKMIDKAKPLPHKDIVTFGNLREDILSEIVNPEATVGTSFETLPLLNNIVKGHRRGELSVYTGPTGAGKTTLLSQLSMDLCAQGTNTLWGSFEIKNTRLMKKMLSQLSGFDFGAVSSSEADKRRVIERFNVAADEFEFLPMYFLKFYGSTDVDTVIDAMEFATYVYDVEHIILDNLQFMMSAQTTASRGLEKFSLQEMALEKFRKFATEHNTHISLVIHPRKEDDDVELSLSSIFGSAKSTQEADNVIILNKTKRGKSLSVKKNRFDGDLGRVELFFDKSSLTYRDTNELRQDNLLKKFTTPANINSDILMDDFSAVNFSEEDAKNDENVHEVDGEDEDDVYSKDEDNFEVCGDLLKEGKKKEATSGAAATDPSSLTKSDVSKDTNDSHY